MAERFEMNVGRNGFITAEWSNGQVLVTLDTNGWMWLTKDEVEELSCGLLEVAARGDSNVDHD